MNVADHIRASLDFLAPFGLEVRRAASAQDFAEPPTPGPTGREPPSPVSIRARTEADRLTVLVHLPDYDEMPAELTIAAGNAASLALSDLVDHAHRAASAMLETVHRDTLEYVRSANAALLSTMEERDILDRVVGIAIEVIRDADSGVFRLFDPDTSRLVVASQIGFDEEFYRYTYQRNESISGAVYGSRRSMLLRSQKEIFDAHRNMSETNLTFLRRTKIANSMICVPVVSDGDCIGTLTVLRFRDEVPFCAYDVTVLETFSTHVAMALKHARDHSRAMENIRLLRGLQAEVAAKNLELASALNIYERIMTAYTGGGSFAEKIERAARDVGLELGYHDLLGNRFASSRAMRDRLAEERLPDGGPPPSPRRSEPGVIRRDVQISGITVGRLVVIDTGDRLLALVKTDVLVSFVTLELVGLATREELVNRRIADVFAEFVESGRIAPNDRRLIDFTPQKFFQIVLVRPVGEPRPERTDLLFQSTIRALRERVRPRNCMLFHTESTLVSFVSAKTATEVEKVSEALVREAGPGRVCCATSGIYSDGAAHARYHRKTNECMEVLVSRGRPGILVADRMGFERLLGGRDRREVLEFVEDVIGPVLAYRNGATALHETLRVFVATGRSTSETARRLGIHPNTVHLRLDRVHQLTGHDATDQQGFMQLAVACHLEEIYGEQRGEDAAAAT